MKHRETPADNFTLAIPGSKLSLLGATWNKSREKANPGANAWEENIYWLFPRERHCGSLNSLQRQNQKLWDKKCPKWQGKRISDSFLMRDTLNNPGGSTCLSSFNGTKHQKAGYSTLSPSLDRKGNQAGWIHPEGAQWGRPGKQTPWFQAIISMAKEKMLYRCKKVLFCFSFFSFYFWSQIWGRKNKKDEI